MPGLEEKPDMEFVCIRQFSVFFDNCIVCRGRKEGDWHQNLKEKFIARLHYLSLNNDLLREKRGKKAWEHYSSMHWRLARHILLGYFRAAFIDSFPV